MKYKISYREDMIAYELTIIKKSKYTGRLALRALFPCDKSKLLSGTRLIRKQMVRKLNKTDTWWGYFKYRVKRLLTFKF